MRRGGLVILAQIGRKARRVRLLFVTPLRPHPLVGIAGDKIGEEETFVVEVRTACTLFPKTIRSPSL